MRVRVGLAAHARTGAVLALTLALVPLGTVGADAVDSGPVGTAEPDVVPERAGSGDLTDLVGGTSLAAVDLAGLRSSPVLTGSATALPRPAARAVIGTDTRVVVPDVTVQPYSHIALLLIDSGNGRYVCSGSLVAEDVLVTAQHCLYDLGGTAGPVAGVTAVFGSDGAREGFACTGHDPVVPKVWSGAQPAEDWGVLDLDCNAGAVVGHFGHRDPGQDAAPEGDWSLTGFPADKRTPAGYPMYTASGPISNFGTQQFAYTISTAGGQSGAPIWRAEPGTSCGNCLVGVHTSTSTLRNFGTRLTLGFKDALDWVVAGRP
jgi:V8-like Glu-specific endopeptidase